MVATGATEVLPKKEVLRLGHEREKLERNLGGIRDMTGLPAAVWVVDTRKEHIAVTEARKLGIPVVAMVDTNCDPDEIDYTIPGNDDAIRAGSLLTRIVADAVAEGLRLRSVYASEATGKEGAAAISVSPADEEPLAEWERRCSSPTAAARPSPGRRPRRPPPASRPAPPRAGPRAAPRGRGVRTQSREHHPRHTTKSQAKEPGQGPGTPPRRRPRPRRAPRRPPRPPPRPPRGRAATGAPQAEGPKRRFGGDPDRGPSRDHGRGSRDRRGPRGRGWDDPAGGQRRGASRAGGPGRLRGREPPPRPPKGGLPTRTTRGPRGPEQLPPGTD